MIRYLIALMIAIAMCINTTMCVSEALQNEMWEMPIQTWNSCHTPYHFQGQGVSD